MNILSQKLCRPIFLILNTLGLIAGLIFLGASIFLLVDKGELLSDVMFLVLARPACIMVIAASTCSVVITALGLLGVMNNSRILLTIYAVIISINILISIVGAIFGIVIVSSYADWIRQAMRESIQQRYGVDVNNNTKNAYETRMWDAAQQKSKRFYSVTPLIYTNGYHYKWYCCGVEDNSWGVYRGSNWYNRQPGTKEYDRPLVPPSCCFTNQYGEMINLQKCQLYQNGPPKLATGAFNEALFYSGCYTFGLTVLNRVARGITAMGFLLALIEIALLFCTVILILCLRKLSNKKNQYASASQHS